MKKRRRSLIVFALVLAGLGMYLWFTRPPALDKPPVALWIKKIEGVAADQEISLRTDASGLGALPRQCAGS